MKPTRRTFAHAAVPLAAAWNPTLMAAAAARKPLTDWYYADALLLPKETTPETGMNAVHGATTDWLGLFNLSSKEAEATLTYYFEELPPRQRKEKLPPRSTRVISHQALPDAELPRKKQFGVRIQTSVPIVAQATRAEHQLVNLAPPALPGNTFLARIAYPGPLGKPETVWAFPDCFNERQKPGKQGWIEFERLTVLNPDPGKDARVRITFRYRDSEHLHQVTVPAQRVRTIEYYKLPFIREMGGFAVIVESTIPVLAEQVRRAYVNFNQQPLGGWIMPGYPLGDADFPLPVVK